MSTKNLRTPNIGQRLRLIGTLVEIQDVTPPPPAKELDYIFEETTARVELLANGHVIGTRGTFNDFYGSAEESAIEEAKKQSHRYGSGVEVRVVRIVHRYRARPLSSEDLYNPGFLNFSSRGPYEGDPLPADVETVVWSSHAKGGA